MYYYFIKNVIFVITKLLEILYYCLVKLKDVVDYYDLGLTEVHSHKQENKIFMRNNNI